MWDGLQAAGARRKRRKPLQSALALLALGILTLVVQPHIDGETFSVHGDGGGVEAGASASIVNPTAPPQSICLICQTLASAGVSLVPLPPAIVTHRDHAETGLAPAGDVLTPRYAGRIWRSRAPPLHA